MFAFHHSITILRLVLGLIACCSFFPYVHTNQETLGKNRLLVISIPKSGTNMLAKCVDLLMGRPYKYKTPFLGCAIDHRQIKKIVGFTRNTPVFVHVPFTHGAERLLAESGIKVLFVHRDPRDQIVSLVYWNIAGKEFPRPC